MPTLFRIALLGAGVIALVACTSEPDGDQGKGEHVWKDQTEAIDKAREVETILKRSQQQQENQ